MAAADVCPVFSTDISAAFSVPTSFKILTCSRLLWGPRSRLLRPSGFSCMSFSVVVTRTAIICTIACSALSTALTCRIASACFLSYGACDYVKLCCVFTIIWCLLSCHVWCIFFVVCRLFFCYILFNFVLTTCLFLCHILFELLMWKMFINNRKS